MIEFRSISEGYGQCTLKAQRACQLSRPIKAKASVSFKEEGEATSLGENVVSGSRAHLPDQLPCLCHVLHSPLAWGHDLGHDQLQSTLIGCQAEGISIGSGPLPGGGGGGAVRLRCRC